MKPPAQNTPQIAKCNLFQFQCPKQWETMTSTDDPDIRFCEQCKQAVYFCRSEAELEAHGRQGHCAAIAVPTRASLTAQPNHNPETEILGGMPATPRHLLERQERAREQETQLNPVWKLVMLVGFLLLLWAMITFQ